jgi:hypothetical protein
MNPEDLLTDALRERVERTDYPSTPLSTVAGRAGAIRARRRRTTALAAAAAVGVVVVPGAVWLNHSPDRSPRPGQSLSSGPSSSPTGPTPPSTALADLPVGHKPGIDYLVGDTYVTMNGDRIKDPAFLRATTATPARGGVLAAVARTGGFPESAGLTAIYLVTRQGHQLLGCGVDRFALSTDRTSSAYWLADTCRSGPKSGRLFSGANNTMGEAATGYVPTPAGSVYEPIGIVRQGTVVNVTHGGTEHAVIVDASGSGNPITALAYAGGANENTDVVAGQLASDPTTGAVVDASTGHVEWRATWTLGQFSPDGRYVIGIRRTDSVGGDEYAVLDAATGHRLVSFAGPGDPVWDTDDTLLSAVWTTDGAAIVRTDFHGHQTLATPIVHGTSYGAGYRFATRP